MRWALAVLFVAACGGGGAAGDDVCTGGTGCGEPCQAANDKGVGLPCTMGGGECSNNLAPFLFCTADYEDGADPYCTGPCSRDSDCGEGAYCSGSGHGGSGCVPAICGGTPSLDAGPADAMPLDAGP